MAAVHRLREDKRTVTIAVPLIMGLFNQYRLDANNNNNDNRGSPLVCSD